MKLTIWDIFHAINRWKFIIVLAVLVCVAGAYFYTEKAQSYTAEIIIKYNDVNSEKGLDPKGNKFDIYEIISPSVIEGAISDLRLKIGIEDVRRSIAITPIVPDEVKEIKKAKTKLGEEYEYFPVQYYVSYRVNSSKDGVYARNMLEAIIKNYDRFYCEKYLNQTTPPDFNNKEFSGNYDYIETAEIINDKVKSIISYLIDTYAQDKDFRSSKTGMNFVDLQREYNNLKNSEIKSLFAYIFSGRLTLDKEKLIKKYEYKIDKLKLESNKKNEESNIAFNILNEYAKNNTVRAQIKTGQNNASSSNTVVQDDKFKKSETTYDKTITQYVDSGVASNNDLIDIGGYQDIVSIFKDDSVLPTVKQSLLLKVNDINKTIERKLSELYSLTDLTLADYRSYKGGKYITYLSSVNIMTNLSFKVYFLISLVMGLALGCVLAITIEIVGKLKVVNKKEEVIEE